MSARLASATTYQREWFARLRDGGGPLALVNADAPQEIFRAMDIPYVVNQWWASIVAAKRQTQRYLGLLRERGYPDYIEQYSATSLASAFETDPEQAPWGGLPAPSIVPGETTGDASRKIFDVWDAQPDITYYALESAAENEVPERWWELMPHRWEEAIGSDRLDLLTGELTGLIRYLEQTTGRVFSETRFREVLALVNEQQEWNRRTRDLIAAAQPCPIAVTDGIPSVMVPQWHQGTEWARDAARAFHDEVSDRITAGVAVCPDERRRLMWIGRGLWFDLEFYQRFQESHGAVFVWSMYLAIAADGYLRYGDDPLRAGRPLRRVQRPALHPAVVGGVVRQGSPPPRRRRSGPPRLRRRSRQLLHHPSLASRGHPGAGTARRQRRRPEGGGADHADDRVARRIGVTRRVS